jgi:hypothetical protein
MIMKPSLQNWPTERRLNESFGTCKTSGTKSVKLEILPIVLSEIVEPFVV